MDDRFRGLNLSALRRLVRRRAGLSALIVAACWIMPACAQTQVNLDIPEGPLSRSLILLGKRAGVSIAVFETISDGVRVRRLRGSLTIDEALRRLLSGTGFNYRHTAAGAIIVMRAPSVRARPIIPHLPRPLAKKGESEVADIIVRASKTDYRLIDYPGAVAVIEEDSSAAASGPARGTGMLVEQLPLLASTYLGPGRNKLSLRGISDSSFNGRSQANVGIYVGEQRLSYGASDPDLNLIDIERVELLPGPRGSLYGIGALGGIIRLAPYEPELDVVSATVLADVTTVKHGGTGGQVAAIANLPIVSDRGALRLVAYAGKDAGYIDDLQGDRSNINDVRIGGGRLALKLRAGDDTEILLGLIHQRVRASDSQYVAGSDGGLSTRIGVAQPYHSDFLLPGLTIRAPLGDFKLVSATSWSRQHSHETTLRPDGFGLLETRASQMVSHETRVSGDVAGTGALIGASVVHNVDREDRILHLLQNPSTITGLSGRTWDAALFAEIDVPLNNMVRATLGARINYIDRLRRSSFDDYPQVQARRSYWDFLPSAALAWKPDTGSLIFLSYRTGSRGADFLPLPDEQEVAVFASRADRLTSFEAGWRGQASPDLSMVATLSYSIWQDIQADLPTPAGNFSTANIGDARIWGLEASAVWRPVPLLRLSGAIFVTSAPRIRLFDEAESEITPSLLALGARLPNVARLGARGAVQYEVTLPDAKLSLAGAMRYYGTTYVEFQARQPGYVDIGLKARLSWQDWALSLAVTNLGDTRSNRFAIGNRFGILAYGEQQSTPLTPRAIRLGIERNF